MEHKILQHKKNPLLHREEIILEVKSKTNPSFEEISESMKKDKKLVVVKGINGNFGRHVFQAEVFVYDSEEAKNKVEYIPMKIRKKLAEAAKAASAA